MVVFGKFQTATFKTTPSNKIYSEVVYLPHGEEKPKAVYYFNKEGDKKAEAAMNVCAGLQAGDFILMTAEENKGALIGKEVPLKEGIMKISDEENVYIGAILNPQQKKFSFWAGIPIGKRPDGKARWATLMFGKEDSPLASEQLKKGSHAVVFMGPREEVKKESGTYVNYKTIPGKLFVKLD